MLMLPGILLEQFSMSFLMVPRAPITTGTVVVLSPHIRSTSISSSLYLVNFCVALTEVLVSRDTVISMRRHNIRPLSCYGPVSVDGHVPQNSDAVIPGDSLGFMLIPSFFHLNARLFADRPVHVCSCLVVAVDIFSFSQFREPRDQVVNGLVETATQTTFWVHVRLLEDVVLVPACWESLILGCDDKALGFSLEDSCFSHLWVLSWYTSACFTRYGYLPWCAFDSHFGPELLATLVFGLGLCSAGIGGVRLILCSWYCGHSQFPTELH